MNYKPYDVNGVRQFRMLSHAVVFAKAFSKAGVATIKQNGQAIRTYIKGKRF